MNAQELADAIKAHVKERLAPHLTEAQRDGFVLIIRENDQIQVDLRPTNVHPTRSAYHSELDIYFTLPSGELRIREQGCCDYLDEYTSVSEFAIADLLIQRMAESATPKPPPPPKPKTATELLQEENAALRAEIAMLKGGSNRET